MLKIGDFSKLAQVSGRTLRYYDELNLLKPHVIDPVTGYRFYSVEQLPRLNRILALKDLGFELERIASLLDQPVSSDDLRAYLLEQETELKERIQADEARLKRVRTRLKQIDQEDDPILIDVTLKGVEAQTAVGSRMIVPTTPDIPFFARMMYSEIYRWLKQHRIPYTATQLIIYHADEYIEQDYDMEAAVLLPAMPRPLPPVPHAAMRVYTLPAQPLMACTIYEGVLREAAKTTRDLIRWCQVHGYTFPEDNLGMREIHFFEQSDKDRPIPLSGIMELQVPVVPPRS
jgi:DNA-binding transcriptional MerR regulator